MCDYLAVVNRLGAVVGGDRDERAKREVEAEAVAYVVGRHFGLDTSKSAFYLAAWQDEESDAIQGRLERISGVAR